MNEGKKHERIPLPPALLTTVPFFTMTLGVAVAFALFPSTVMMFVGAALGFIVPLAWLAKRTRR